MALRIGDPFPGLSGATEWLNGDVQGPDSPVLVHFWAISCGICKQKMPDLNMLKKTYAATGLTAISVHMPLAERDTDVEAVRSAAVELGLTEPLAIDNLHRMRESFGNDHGWVPVYFLFDAEGRLKLRAAGEYGVGMLRASLERMFPDTDDSS